MNLLDERITAPVPARPLATTSQACEVAEYLLSLLARGHASSVWLDPSSGGIHRVMLHDRADSLSCFTLADGLGDAILARLALLAGLDLLRPSSQVGTAEIVLDDRLVEVVVTSRPTESGLGGELRLLDERTERLVLGDSAAEQLEPGDQIGPYVISEVLGRGGMGVVYAADHPILKRQFAIKVLASEVLLADPASARRFVREAQAAARIRHPAIVDVTDFGTLPDGRPYLVMERLPGRSLGELLAQTGALEPARAVALASRIAEALAAAHGAGVLHRDLTPGNVFVLESPEGTADRVVLVDFGAATTTDPEHATIPDGPPGMVLGTPHYLPPEIAMGHEADARTDIYALGSILFELVTGTAPFHGTTPRDVVIKHLSAPVPPITSPFGPLPDELVALIRRAMAKKQENRHASAAALVGDLGRVAQQLQRTGWRRFLPL